MNVGFKTWFITVDQWFSTLATHENQVPTIQVHHLDMHLVKPADDYIPRTLVSTDEAPDTAEERPSYLLCSVQIPDPQNPWA